MIVGMTVWTLLMALAGALWLGGAGTRWAARRPWVCLAVGGLALLAVAARQMVFR